MERLNGITQGHSWETGVDRTEAGSSIHAMPLLPIQLLDTTTD